MVVQTKNTSKGVVIRYVFDDVNEYAKRLEFYEEIVNEDMSEEYRENLKSVIQLFKEYYEESNRYCDGKPTVTIFENHIYKIGALLFDIEYLCMEWSSKYLTLLKEHVSLLKEHKSLIEEQYSALKEEQAMTSKLRSLIETNDDFATEFRSLMIKFKQNYTDETEDGKYITEAGGSGL